MGMLFKWLSHSVLLEVTHPHPFLPSSLWVPSGAGNDTLSLPSSNFGEDALHFPQKNPVVWWKIEVSVWVRTPIKSKRRLSTFSTQPITRMGGLGPKLYRLWNTSSTGYQGSKDSSLDKVFFSAHCRVWATLGKRAWPHLDPMSYLNDEARDNCLRTRWPRPHVGSFASKNYLQLLSFAKYF